MKVLKILLGLFLLIGLGAQVLAQEPTHWNKNMLLVYIPEGNEYSVPMAKAFREWEGKFSRKIQFIITNFNRDIRLAEIEVQFKQVTGEGAENSGNTTLTGQTNTYRHGTVVINTLYDEEIEKDPVKKAKNDEEIYRIMMHEVGKVLGLPSSDNPQSVMNDKIEDGQTILQEDVDKVYERYGWRARGRG